jgi:PhoH-like ATPase
MQQNPARTSFIRSSQTWRLACRAECSSERYLQKIETRTYVLDTSVLLADPAALEKFEEHEVVVPLVVLMELEAKRLHPELGWSAREALRYLERLRIEHGTLTEPIPVNDVGGTVRVELNHVDTSSLPAAFSSSENDHRILAVGRNLADKGLLVTLVSKDLPLRLKASVAGLGAEEYRNEITGSAEGWSGLVELATEAETIDRLYQERSLFLAEAADLPTNAGLVLRSPSSSALARLHSDGRAHLLDGDRHLFDVRGRSAEQRVALDLLSDDSVGIVSLGGPAGTGKSVLALAAGLEAVLERRTQKKVIVFRPLYAVGGQDLGFLPGDADEKMGPWAAAVNDALESIAGPEVIEEVIARKLLEVLPLTHIRGRTLTDTFVIVDEAQNLEKMVLLTALTRLGAGSRVVLTHDVAQRDNLHVGRYDGVASVVSTLRGNSLFGHVTLTRSERSPVAALVTELLGSS